ncbi:unnamed protein product [Symbiodinium necroappetens]|uniref:Uncharacterized protein n=1 Tax=Symbiodinium necroappetens TaxID=1628268 RepID=A0A813BLS6_9DINO|nr:unnamed protein product [Symbiodinium necroappetens]
MLQLVTRRLEALRRLACAFVVVCFAFWQRYRWFDQSQRSRHRPRGAPRPAPSAVPFSRPATAEELGDWHFGGRRRWLWFHDGQTQNGWFELGAAGGLRVEIGRSRGGSWWRGWSGELVVSFGRCHHVLELTQAAEIPTFRVKERKMKDGSVARAHEAKTIGKLDLSFTS